MSWISKLFGRSAASETPSAAPVARSPRTVSASADQIIAFMKSALVAVAAENGKRLDAVQIDADRPLYESGYLDSTNLIEFLMRIEAEYGVAIPDYAIGDNARTLNALCAYVGERMTDAPP